MVTNNVRMIYTFTAPMEKHELLLGLLKGEVDNLSYRKVGDRDAAKEQSQAKFAALREKPPSQWASGKLCMSLLANAGHPVSSAELVDQMTAHGYSVFTVRNLIFRLKKEGFIRSKYHGVYELAR